MTLVRKGQGREIQLTQPALFKFHRYLFLLSHARSFSTMLCHILGSHPQISGYSEAMIPYETAVDLIRLNCKVFEAGNYHGDREYVIDKILYDNFAVSDVILRNPRVTPIFLVREPASAIASHARMRIREQEQGVCNWGPQGTDPMWNAEVAAVYYISRLGGLQALCTRLDAMGKRGLFLTADGLMTDTDATFRLLERELGLSERLNEEYRLFPKTGARGCGDTSSVIKSGRIVRDRDHRDEEPIPIRSELLNRARRAYDGCLATLRASRIMARVGE
jgi:hypothetical protein